MANQTHVIDFEIQFCILAPVSGEVIAYLGAGQLVGLDALHEGDGVRVELVGLVGQVDDGKRHTEAQPLEVTHLQRECKGQTKQRSKEQLVHAHVGGSIKAVLSVWSVAIPKLRCKFSNAYLY